MNVRQNYTTPIDQDAVIRLIRLQRQLVGLIDGEPVLTARIRYFNGFVKLKDWKQTAAALDTISGHSDIHNLRLNQGTPSERAKLAEMSVLPATNSHRHLSEN